MRPLRSIDEVYAHLATLRGPDGDGEPDVIALFTVALIEKERIDWIEHIEEQSLPQPDEAEISAWYASKPASYFTDKMRRGESAFATFARVYLKDEIDIDRARAIHDTVGSLRSDVGAAKTDIVSYIEMRTKSRGWLVNIASGLISNFGFTLVAAVLAYATINNVSIIDTLSRLMRTLFGIGG